ncbi:MAG: S-adenosylmethionine:tRNA ribosyltransferase-isomerase, partial [Alistipes sp.]|nr:S-adenosylmethionine:tRNA ribosyltransferase-isomerase [Alistipes sp.]
MKPEHIDISLYDYDLPEERIAKFPLPERDASKLLVWNQGRISQTLFSSIGSVLPHDSLLVFNDTKVIRARILLRKNTGALIEIFCLEPHRPADHERSLASTGLCQWRCIVGNSKKWKKGELAIRFPYDGREYTMTANRAQEDSKGQIVIFQWDAPLAFGELLEILGRIPIPPYLGRDSDPLDNTRYQTVYSRFEGSVAAPTAGLHFTRTLIDNLAQQGISFAAVTQHVGAVTFLP